MVREIRLYIEGDRSLRAGFGQFFERVRESARHKKIRWDIILCGSRDASFDAFKTAIQTHPNSFNMLLVDSEGPVAKTAWQHLINRDRWERPEGVGDDHCHLMAQAMEAWFVADLATLRAYYGKGFNEKPIPKRKDVEEIDRKELVESLVLASKNTCKGTYHKVRHGEKILARLNETTVRARASHCERLFKILEELINPSPAENPAPAEDLQTQLESRLE